MNTRLFLLCTTFKYALALLFNRIRASLERRTQYTKVRKRH